MVLPGREKLHAHASGPCCTRLHQLQQQLQRAGREVGHWTAPPLRLTSVCGSALSQQPASFGETDGEPGSEVKLPFDLIPSFPVLLPQLEKRESGHGPNDPLPVACLRHLALRPQHFLTLPIQHCAAPTRFQRAFWRPPMGTSYCLGLGHKQTPALPAHMTPTQRTLPIGAKTYNRVPAGRPKATRYLGLLETPPPQGIAPRALYLPAPLRYATDNIRTKYSPSVQSCSWLAVRRGGGGETSSCLQGNCPAPHHPATAPCTWDHWI